MSFNENCIFLDKTKMNRPVIDVESMDGKEPYVGTLHYFCNSPNRPGNWILECPMNCPNYKER